MNEDNDPATDHAQRRLAASDVVLRVPAPAPVRSAAYRMLADLPGISFDQSPPSA